MVIGQESMLEKLRNSVALIAFLVQIVLYDASVANARQQDNEAVLWVDPNTHVIAPDQRELNELDGYSLDEFLAGGEASFVKSSMIVGVVVLAITISFCLVNFWIVPLETVTEAQLAIIMLMSALLYRIQEGLRAAPVIRQVVVVLPYVNTIILRLSNTAAGLVWDLMWGNELDEAFPFF